MDKTVQMLRHALGIGLVWTLVWGLFLVIVGLAIAIAQPHSIGPGEGPLVAAAVLGPMGLFSGIAFGILLKLGGRGRTSLEQPLTRVVAWGVLGTAIVQLAYLDHGDLGLVANIQEALLFSAFGGLVTIVWFLMARGWSQWRATARSSA